MDRRQRKTRDAIFEAFISLLNEKSYSKITVGEIIERADIGRATFYAHFETKDYLLKALCEELFCHIFDCMQGENERHNHIFECDAPDSVFLHLFEHIAKNDNHILKLLSCDNNELFLNYFKKGVLKIIESNHEDFRQSFSDKLPVDFITNHIAVTFVETVRWWINNKLVLSPEEINSYFNSVIKGEEI